MISKLKTILHPFLVGNIGNLLVFLQPKKARQLSENRITLIHKNKNSMTIPERLMRGALVKKLNEIEHVSNSNFATDTRVHSTRDFF